MVKEATETQMNCRKLPGLLALILALALVLASLSPLMPVRAAIEITPPGPVQTVQPFAVRCAPVVLEIPEGVELPDGYNFEFWIAVSEGGDDSGGSMQSVRAYQQRWLVSCRQRGT